MKTMALWAIFLLAGAVAVAIVLGKTPAAIQANRFSAMDLIFAVSFVSSVILIAQGRKMS